MSSRPSIFLGNESDGDRGASGMDLGQIAAVLRQHWLVISFCTAVGVGIGVFSYKTTPRLFRATAIVQIERRSLATTVGGGDSYLDSWWNTEYYPTQYRLLRSRGLAELVVDKLILDPVAGFDPTSLSNLSSDIDPADAKAAMANQLRGALTINPINGTELVEVSYDSADPELARELANGFAEGFVEWGQANRRELVSTAASFLAGEIDNLKDKIGDTDRRLKERQASDSLIVRGGRAENADSRLASLTESYSAAVGRRIEREARYQSVLDAPAASIAAGGGTGSRVGQLTLEQDDRERRYVSLLETYKPEWPEMLELKAEIERGAQDLREAIDEAVQKSRQEAYSEYQTVLREEEQLLSEISRLRGEALLSSPQSVDLENLQRELESKQSQLQGILERQAKTAVEARLDASTDVGNVRVIDRALLPGAPYQPNLKTNLMTSSSGGLAFGVALAFLLAFLDRSIKTADEAESILGLPTLGVIADLSSSRRRYSYYGDDDTKRRRKRRLNRQDIEIELVPMRHPRLAVTEAFRSLRAALLLSSAEELRVLVVTSAAAGEGKTSTAMNLACVMAQLGKRVLLLDGDLHRPRQHKVFGVSNRVGLVSCLTGGMDPREAAQSTEFDNLSLTPSGPHPPNPSELLGSERMKDVIAVYRSSFDIVIIDTPPVLAVSDAALIGSNCDGVVFCVRAGKTPREQAKSAVDRLRFSEVRILGTVLNGHVHQAGSYQRYQYYQYYLYSEADETNSAA